MAERFGDTRTRNAIALITALSFFGAPALVLVARVLGLLQNSDMEQILGMWTTYFERLPEQSLGIILALPGHPAAPDSRGTQVALPAF